MLVMCVLVADQGSCLNISAVLSSLEIPDWRYWGHQQTLKP